MFPAKSADPPQPAWMRAWSLAAGRGLTLEAARTGAIFEAVERSSLSVDGADDPRHTRKEDLPHPAIDGREFWQLSTEQLEYFQNTTMQPSGCTGHGRDTHHTLAADLFTGERVPVPSSAVFVDEDGRLGWPVRVGSSSGAAAHPDRDAAVRAAVLERVERDAVAIWWYNRLTPPRLTAASLLAALPDALGAWITARVRPTWCLLAETDLPVPAVLALSAAPDGTRPAIGAAAHLDPATAVLSAVLEMLQCEISLAHMRAAQAAPDPPPIPDLLAWSEACNAGQTGYLAGAGEAALPEAVTFPRLLAALSAAGVDVAVADITRPELGIPVVKAVSRSLRDWRPAFAPGRLFDVPVATGRLPAPLGVGDLNPVPFVI